MFVILYIYIQFNSKYYKNNYFEFDSCFGLFRTYINRDIVLHLLRYKYKYECMVIYTSSISIMQVDVLELMHKTNVTIIARPKMPKKVCFGIREEKKKYDELLQGEAAY